MSPPLVTCPHCGSIVPAGSFCGHCGAPLASEDPRRTHAFAAVPSERVFNPSIVSTLFPHLPRHRNAPFQLALAAGVLLVVILAAFHLFAPATVAAVLVLPVLYLIYLYEVEIYESEPWLVIGATMIAGAVLGFAFTSVTGGLLSRSLISADNETAFVLAGVVIPIFAQILMLVGPLILYVFRRLFREPLDGLAFGAASALGFSLASSMTEFWPLLSGPLVASGSPVDWAVRLARAGLLVAVINASTTAVVAASLWLNRSDPRGKRPWRSSILAAVAVAFVVQIGLGTLSFVVQDLPLEVAIRVVVAAALLIYVRVVIHDALLVESAEHEIGPEAECPECHRLVPTMSFCPACGAARSAMSKHNRPGVVKV